MKKKWILISLTLFIISCSKNEDSFDVDEDYIDIADENEEEDIEEENEDDNDSENTDLYTITNVFGNNIDLSSLSNYESQSIPDYITKDNTDGNTISDEKATLGRILFYDTNLSANNTISCSSCHQQAFAFGDPNIASTGVNGVTGRHSMRLINTRFADEENYFWDERATSLEDQTTQPIQDHIEMGFSGEDGDLGIADLLVKLENLEYYQELFSFAYGDTDITENRLQESLSQFIRSIQSFDSKYDTGRAMVRNDNQDFPNFTDEENQGKSLFMSGRNNDGANCVACHRSPEFDIDPDSDNNGVVGVFGNLNANDFEVTRSPSLRDLVNNEGVSNGPFMHDGSLATIRDVVEHYNAIDGNGNPNLDNQLGRNGQNLNLSDAEMEALEAFLMTLSGSNLYTDEKWSDPFLN